MSTTFIEILSTDDDLWESWKSIYLASFPAHERMTVAYFEGVLAAPVEDGAGRHMLAMVAESNLTDVQGILYFETDREARISFLWYLAIRDDLRNQRLGPALYAEVRNRAESEGLDLLVFEVEIPEEAAAHSDLEGEIAARRIRWYQRQGALLVKGVEYYQDVDSTDERTLMYLMVDYIGTSAGPDALYQRLETYFAGSISKLGPVSLNGLGESV